jgi:collagen type VII alpha
VKSTRKLRVFLVLAALVAVSFSVFGFSKTAIAANPTTISFQGKVVNANGTNVTDGSYTFLFKLYTVSSGGSAIWTETQTSVPVVSGTFQVNLGSVCPFFTANACNSSTPIDFNANPALYLGITFNGDAAGEMTPRPQLQSVPYAYNADKVGGLAVSQLVQLSPGTQQTGFANLSGNITSAATVQGVTVTATGALQGNSLSINSGAFAVNSTGNVTAVLSATTGATLACQNASSQLSTCTNTYAQTTDTTDFIRNQTGVQTANLNIQSAASGSVIATLQGASGQTADLLDLMTGGAKSAFFNNGGSFTIGLTQATSARFTVNSSVTTNINEVLKGILSQTGDFLEVQDSTAAVLDKIAANGALTVAAGGESVTGATSIAGGTITLNDSSNNATNINAGSSTGAVTIGNGSAGAITVQSNSTVGITAPSGINLNNNTVVTGSATATSVITPSLTAAGALSISSGGATNVTLDTGASGGTIAIGGTNATAVNISRTGELTTVNGGLTVNQTATLNGPVVMTFNGTENLAITSDQVGSSNGISFIATPSTTAGTTSGLFVQQAASANTNGLDVGVTIDNANTTLAVGTAINITNTGGGGYTNLIQSANFSVTGAGNASVGGSLGITGTSTFAGGATISAFSGGSWLNLPTTGPSAIGTGGAGNNALVAYVPATGNYFTDAATGDIAYRNTTGNLLFGTSSGYSQFEVHTTSEVFQNSTAVPLLTIDNTNTKVQVGSGTTDATQVNLQLDSSSSFADQGTCTTTSSQGAMYFNTASNSIRSCINGGWEDLVSTSGLGILAFGVIADTGSQPGDIANKSSATAAAGPCKVAWLSTSSVTVTACSAYSGGRKVEYAGGTFTGITTTANDWTHICFANATTPFAPNSTLAALTFSTTETGNLPQWNSNNPVVCVADIKGTGANINIYDTRVFTNTQKTFVNTAVAMGIGWIARDNSATSAATVTSSTAATQASIKGVIVASAATACTSACGPNAILAYSGPVYVKSLTGALTLGNYVGTSATAGYGVVATNSTTLNTYEALGIGETAFVSTCSSAVNCNLSMLVDVDIR